MRKVTAALVVFASSMLISCGGSALDQTAAGAGMGELVPGMVQGGEIHVGLPSPGALPVARRAQDTIVYTFAESDVLAGSCATMNGTQLELSAPDLSWCVLGVAIGPSARPETVHVSGTSNGVYVGICDFDRQSWRWLGRYLPDVSLPLPAAGHVQDDSFYVALVCPSGFMANVEVSVSLVDEPSGEGTWNLMVWMAADNPRAEYAYQAIQQLEQLGSNDDINVLVGYDIDPLQLEGDYSGVEQAHYIKVVPDDDPLSIDVSGDPANLSFDREKFNSADSWRVWDFVSWAQESFPAEHSALVLWGVGDGWRENCGG